ncbi:hypothetical protein BH20ACT15_BH20ACT15_16230 [soil metagenome]
MVDIVFSEIELPPTDIDWKTAMRQRAISTREVLNRHRWAVGLMESRATPGPASFQLHNAVLGCLRDGGFSIPGLLRPRRLHLRLRPPGSPVRQRRGKRSGRGGAGPPVRRARGGPAVRRPRGGVPLPRRSRRGARRQGRLRLHGRVRVRPRPHPRRARETPRHGLTARRSAKTLTLPAQVRSTFVKSRRPSCGSPSVSACVIRALAAGRNGSSSLASSRHVTSRKLRISSRSAAASGPLGFCRFAIRWHPLNREAAALTWAAE